MYCKTRILISSNLIPNYEYLITFGLLVIITYEYKFLLLNLSICMTFKFISLFIIIIYPLLFIMK